MQRISLFISDPQYRQLQDLARARDRTASELIRTALDNFLLTAGLIPPSPAPRPRPVTRRRPAKR